MKITEEEKLKELNSLLEYASTRVPFSYQMVQSVEKEISKLKAQTKKPKQ